MHLPQPHPLANAANDPIARKVFSRGADPLSPLLLVRPWLTWTPVFTNLTNVGSPVITGRYIQGEGRVFFQVKVVPGTTSASVAGSTYVALPTTAGGIGGSADMQDITTFISIGDCAFDVTNSRCYTPSQGATGDTLTIAGWYEG